LTPSRIRRVLSILATHQVQHLLMGGQACVLYGGAEFSRDLDVVLFSDPENLSHQEAALLDLDAECIAVPPFTQEYLLKGHAAHFRCHNPQADRLRLEVMAKQRGLDPFLQLWDRRTTLAVEEELSREVLGLEDLVRAKKTQKDKDWPMIRRLVEAHHASHRNHAAAEQIRFWFQEARTVSLLVKLADSYPDMKTEAAPQRPLLALAAFGQEPSLEAALLEEECKEREADKRYWLPLKQELERLRHPRSA
jgi:hypothetical protein